MERFRKVVCALMVTDDPLARLQEGIGYSFEDLGLLTDALTHRSFLNERPKLARCDNERMEFLGDAILGLAASALLWRQYPSAPEGELSRRRADLVCESALATIARALELGEALRLGKGEEKSGGRDKPRLLASALEALVAAVYLDAGEREAISVARALLAPYVDAIQPGETDYKSRLQELLQARTKSPPVYALLGTDGPDHDRLFHVEVRLGERRLGRGTGRSKLSAEMLAAKHALADIELGEIEL
jgi:ribonuclease-3